MSDSQNTSGIRFGGIGPGGEIPGESAADATARRARLLKTGLTAAWRFDRDFDRVVFDRDFDRVVYVEPAVGCAGTRITPIEPLEGELLSEPQQIAKLKRALDQAWADRRDLIEARRKDAGERAGEHAKLTRQLADREAEVERLRDEVRAAWAAARVAAAAPPPAKPLLSLGPEAHAAVCGGAVLALIAAILLGVPSLGIGLTEGWEHTSSSLLGARFTALFALALSLLAELGGLVLWLSRPRS